MTYKEFQNLVWIVCTTIVILPWCFLDYFIWKRVEQDTYFHGRGTLFKITQHDNLLVLNRCVKTVQENQTCILTGPRNGCLVCQLLFSHETVKQFVCMRSLKASRTHSKQLQITYLTPAEYFLKFFKLFEFCQLFGATFWFLN